MSVLCNRTERAYERTGRSSSPEFYTRRLLKQTGAAEIRKRDPSAATARGALHTPGAARYR